MEKYKSAKIPLWVHQNEQLAEVFLARKGLDKIPKEVLEPKACPICNSKMEEFIAQYQYLRCPSCNYIQQKFTTVSNFTTGIVVGLGLALLLYWLFK